MAIPLIFDTALVNFDKTRDLAGAVVKLVPKYLCMETPAVLQFICVSFNKLFCSKKYTSFERDLLVCWIY